MPITLTNLQTSRPLHVPLNGGATVRLSPGETSAALPDVEVSGNAKVEKLAGLGLLGIGADVPADDDAADSTQSRTTARSGARSRARKEASTADDGGSTDEAGTGSDPRR
jgi:hypothetical protein